MTAAEHESLVLKWQPLVWKIALALWKCQPGVRRVGSIDDLVSLGQIGLLRAIELYNPEHVSGASPMTYFHRSIYNTMLRDATGDNMIAVPERVRRSLRGKEVRGQTYADEGRLALKVRALSPHFERCHPASEKREDARLEGLQVALKHLLPHELALLAERFGLDGQEPSTFRQMADRRNRSRERMRQLLSRIYSKIRKYWPREYG